MDVIDWLLEGDPAIRWQVKADLLAEPPSAIEKERSRVGTEGWGKLVLDRQDDDGRWGGGFYSPKWISTTYTLLLLRHFGVNPASRPVRQAIKRLKDGGNTWRQSGHDTGVPFFQYREEICVTAMNLALASYFQQTAEVAATAEYLLEHQMDDGGWNCEIARGSRRSSFHTTISTVEGLLEFERATNDSGLARASAAARVEAQEYMLQRRLMRSLSTGQIIEASWTRFSFPPRWWYDVLRGLEYLRDSNVSPDSRWDEALELVENKATKDRRWKLQNYHSGREHFRMEKPGQPSRWNTLRAMRVLAHAES